jgi:hypothetical protein
LLASRTSRRLDLAIDLDGTSAGRIQTFVPRGRALPPGTFDVGIGLREHARGNWTSCTTTGLAITMAVPAPGLLS